MRADTAATIGAPMPAVDVATSISGEALFTRLLYSGPGADILARFPAEALQAEAMATLAFMAQRRPGVPSIRFRPHSASAISSDPPMVLEIINDDMPFLVDSVVAELSAHALSARLVLHPTVKVQRSAEGRLLAVTGAGDSAWSAGGQESVMVLHLGALAAAAVASLLEGLNQVLADVRRATGDWQAMRARLDDVIRGYSKAPPPVSGEALAETLSFCDWLREGHFTFLGSRVHEPAGSDAGELVPAAASGLGLLRDTSLSILDRGGEAITLKTPVIERASPVATSSGLLAITKSSIRSRVHRRVLMDCVSLTSVDGGGRVCGDVRFVGLFTHHAYTQPVRQIPVLRQRAATVIEASGLPPDGHSGKTLAAALDEMPRDEMFQLTMPELTEWAAGMVDLDLRPRVRLFTRVDGFGRFISALLFLPRDRFKTRLGLRIASLLANAFDGSLASLTPYFPEGPLVRVHYVIDTPAPTIALRPARSTAELEAEIDALSRSWDERLAEQVSAARGPDVAARYIGAFPPDYAEAFPLDRVIEDIGRIERLSPSAPMAIDFHGEPTAASTAGIRATILRLGEPIPLSERVPILENLGFAAIEEHSYRIRPRLAAESVDVALHHMELATVDGRPIELERHRERIAAAYLAVEARAADNDSFNRLLIATGADWREAMLLRALSAYMRQIRSPFGPRYIADTLLRHSGIARDLIEAFRTRHDPDLFADDGGSDTRRAQVDQILVRIEGALTGVESLDEDRILRALAGLMRACLRTNFFQRGPDGAPPATLALKFDPKLIDGVPSPRPYREIFVYSPRVEGVHLRFGPVARGGLRWSDRAQDFRTEVLGLCKAQQVKNTVIVPTGSKGGFVPKLLPRSGSRDEVMREGIAAYEIFVGALLDVTDNLVDRRVVPPDRVVRHDGDDPYLVVAADKGTATFSDHANAIATSRGFWLGDAFASGGSAGYDHKKMAITARGAWECVKRHFRELDWDIQTRPFRVAGVGDMSGDVFGNGMLLSPAIRLVAAFDHRDIFIDPDPDPATGFAERKRLFTLPRSSWQDYDRRLISRGGGVFPRSAKSIVVTPEMREALGLPPQPQPIGGSAAEIISPQDLMRAILMAQVDLLWFGGIGTYVRGSTESDEAAGDRANDAIRVTGAELRCAVIGEGANLGVTQRGRMEFASRGGRLNTDFIDNSAGVNSSDQEVNIKIALAGAIGAGRLLAQERNGLLASMTDDVAAACLVNNTQQSLALSLAERRSPRDIGHLGELMRQLERRGLLDRPLEALPSDRDLAARDAAKAGMTRPELAVLLSWSKIALSADLAATTVPDDPATLHLLVDYFPPALRERFGEQIRGHRLAREIVTMRVTNSIINRGGPTFVSQLAEATGRPVSDIAYAYLAVRSIYTLPELWAEIDALDNRMPGTAQLDLYAATQESLLAETASVLRSAASQSLGEMIDRYRPTAATLPDLLPRVLAGGQSAALEAATTLHAGRGAPQPLARRVAALPAMGRTIAIADLAAATGSTTETAARAQFAADDAVRLQPLCTRAEAVEVGDYYDRLALAGALSTLASASTTLARQALEAGGDPCDPVAHRIAGGDRPLARSMSMLDGLARDPTLTVSRLVVAAGQLREVIGT